MGKRGVFAAVPILGFLNALQLRHACTIARPMHNTQRGSSSCACISGLPGMAVCQMRLHLLMDCSPLSRELLLIRGLLSLRSRPVFETVARFFTSSPFALDKCV